MKRLSGLILVVGALGALAGIASASTINYTTTGTLVLVSGTDPLSLGGNVLTLTNSLDTNQIPVSSTPLANGGIQDIYNTTVTITGNITLTSTSAQITLTWYPHPNSGLGQIDSIGLNATAKILGISGTFTSNIPIVIPGATPSPLLNTPLPSNSTVTAKVGLVNENATFGFAPGASIQGIGPTSGVPEPGTVTMLSGGMLLAAGAFLRKALAPRK